MTEEEWLANDEPGAMLAILIACSATERKLRLSLVAAARTVWDRFPEGEIRDGIQVAENYADGQAQEELRQDYSGRYYRHYYRDVEITLNGQELDWFRDRENWPLHELARMSCYSSTLLHSSRAYLEKWPTMLRPFAVNFVPLLRDIFGNPFRPVAFDPRWRTSTAVGVAQTMYDARAFGAMPILADALQDAGCEDAAILAHCHDESQVHVRGCWVVDLVLGKC